MSLKQAERKWNEARQTTENMEAVTGKAPMYGEKVMKNISIASISIKLNFIGSSERLV